MIHEYSFSKMYYSREVKDEKELFKNMIDVAIKTMWAFDDLEYNNEEMQIRRGKQVFDLVLEFLTD